MVLFFYVFQFNFLLLVCLLFYLFILIYVRFSYKPFIIIVRLYVCCKLINVMYIYISIYSLTLLYKSHQRGRTGQNAHNATRLVQAHSKKSNLNSHSLLYMELISYEIISSRLTMNVFLSQQAVPLV